ncbi:DUF975 family protein [Paenibacillus rigui]|uniref:DUF975 domain-containing protein n=1 Tax=Paenibacillus rigui TaxID=554312 RepID=A0A229UKE7_9BACL|nr:DUF975 family protein [Paenibacillus rigui]OXM83774.1 hypothetical protein CF651_23795 [Paenibacillus rigui]
MWTRSELKDRAKQGLRTSYWKAFLVSLLLVIISGNIPSCSFRGDMGQRADKGKIASMFNEFKGNMDQAADHTVLLTVLIIAIIIGILAALVVIAFRIFLCFPLEVGGRQYFKQAALEDANLNHLGFAFSKGRYLAIVKGMLWRAFLNFLWFLLLIIPGIVKAYAYSMVPYILADNPGIGTRRAVELSNRMTRGHKWNMFVLDLSFLGWYLLGTLALLVGVLFVEPYVNATKAELYLVLRRQALQAGISSNAELNVPEYE